MSTVAVTGSSGKLGRHVVAHLAEHGHRVIALDRVPLLRPAPPPSCAWTSPTSGR